MLCMCSSISYTNSAEVYMDYMWCPKANTVYAPTSLLNGIASRHENGAVVAEW